MIKSKNFSNMLSLVKLEIFKVRFLILIILLHQTIYTESKYTLELDQYYLSNYRSPTTTNDIAQRWKTSNAAIRGAFLNLVHALLPSAFEVAVSTNISSTCSTAFIEYMRGLSKMNLWAFKMMDAAGKLPTGFFGGSPTALGDFDTCLKIEPPSSKFKGKYCFIDISLPLPKRKLFSRAEEPIPELQNVMEPGSTIEEIAKKAQFLYALQTRTSICVPSTCSRSEVKNIVYRAMKIGKTGFELEVPNCEVSEPEKFSSGDIMIILLFTVLFTLVIMGTILDTYLLLKYGEDFKASQLGTGMQCLLCFSLYTNYCKLLKIDYNPDAINVFHGMRVLSMLWVILCHTYMAVNYRAFNNLLHAKDYGKEWWFQPVVNGFFSVETFFFMSSVLVVYICMKIKEKISVPLFFLRRFWRLTPPMMLLVAIYSISRHFGSGPLWRETVVDKISKNCRDHGWWNLLYINSYTYSPNTCMGWTWYISADMHLFLISLYVIIILKKNPRRGFMSIAFLLIASTLLTAFCHIYYKLPPTYLQSFISFDDWYYYAVNGYTPTHFHIPVCCIGQVVGYILATRKLHMSKFVNLIGWIVSLTSASCIVFSTYYWNQGHVPGLLVSALYGSTSRSIWALCLAFFTISCVNGYGGIVSRILSWNVFVPLGRLTYMVFLTHYGLVYLYTGAVRSTITYDNITLIFLYFSVTGVSFIISCFLSLTFESPFMALEKILLSRLISKRSNPVRTVNGMEKSTKEYV